MIFFDKVKHKVLVVTHEGPDADGIACTALLRHLLKDKEVTVLFSGSVGDQSKAVLKLCGLEPVKEAGDFETLIVVDTNSLPNFEKYIPCAKTKILIDHHSPKPEVSALFDVAFIDEGASSCSELLWELFDGKIEADRKLSLALACGIFLDSAGFISARPKTFKILSEILGKHDIPFGEVLDIVNIPPELSEKIARLKGAQRMAVERVGDHLVVTTKVSSFEGIVANSLLGVGADVAFVGASKPKGDEVRIAGRARRALVANGFNLGNYVMPEAAKILGGDGGGHAAAAGATGTKPEKLDEALKKCLELTKAFIEKKQKA